MNPATLPTQLPPILSVFFALLAAVLGWLLWVERRKRHAGSNPPGEMDDLEGLLRISEASAAVKDSADFYEQLLDVIVSVTGFTQAGIHLYDAKKNRFMVVACRGWTEGMLAESGVMEQEVFGPLKIVIDTKEVVTIDDIRHTPHYIHKASLDAGYISLAEVPLLAGSLFMGMISIATKELHHWTQREIRWLGSVGRQVGVAIFRLQHADQLRDLATLQERERISQEIHDELSQLIGALALLAQKVGACLDGGDLESVRQGLDEIEKTARDAYGSVREEILSLREAEDPREGLVRIIAGHLQRFERQWKVRTHLEVAGPEADFSADFPVEIQILRIFQEAMTNIRRHAQASEAWVHLEADALYLYMEIEDNGVGFNPAGVPHGHFGLRIMQERAGDVRGSVQIHSTPGAGARVEVISPKQPEGRLVGAIRQV